MSKRPELAANKVDKLITFIYYKDLQKGIDFYENFMGFPLAIDQGWSKIYQISEAGYVGVVDEKRGMQDWHQDKTVQICLRVPDVEPWYTYCQDAGVPQLTDLKSSEELQIRAFAFSDPEGYQIEIQEAL